MSFSLDPLTGVMTRRPENAVPAAPSPGVGMDAVSAMATAWGTGHSGRGTQVFSPLNRLHDMTPMERRESIKRSRFMANRLGLGRALVEGSSRYSVGSGIIGYASTGDQGYDDACNRFCDSILEDPQRWDVRGEMDYYEMQEAICPAMMTDGDCGAAKILERGAGGRITGTPQAQLFTTEQIDSGVMTDDSADWVEGVKRDAFGRATHYRVVQQPLPGMTRMPGAPTGPKRYRDYLSRDFLLVLDPKRIGISRGIPWTHHGQASAITMMDLKTLEESAAYLNAFFGAVITTQDGSIPEGLEGMIFKSRFNKTNQEATPEGEEEPATSTKEDYRQYAQFMNGALIPVMKEGEKLQMVASERPSLTFTGFMDWLVNDIAWGFGIPPAYVWAIAGKAGPEVRLTLKQAQWFFEMIVRRMVSRFCRPMRNFVIDYGLLTGRLNGGRVPNNGVSPYQARWHGARAVTIDEGREGKLEMERIEHGFGTEEEYHARRGLDGDTVAKQRILEIERRMAWCKERGVPLELYFGRMPGQGIGTGAAGLVDAAGNPLTPGAAN